MISPRRARYSRAASSREAHASSAGAGASRPGGRLELTSFFSHVADALTAHLDSGLAGQDGGEFLTTPLRVERAMVQRVVVDKMIEVLRQRTGHCGRATRSGAIGEPLDPLMGKAMDPCTQRRIGKVERVR